MGVYFEKEENYNNLAANTGSKGDGWNEANMYEVFAWEGADGSGTISGGSEVVIY
jgi:hypothetical protein